MFRQILYGLLMWGTTIYAFRRGGRDEKLAALAIVIASYLTLLVLPSLTRHFQQMEMPLAILDGSLAVFLLILAMISQKFWPMWLTAMQSLTVVAHFALLVPHMVPWGYWNAAVIWSYPMWIVLGFAVYMHHRDMPKQPKPLA